jgi:UDP-N-acetylglucosamine 2-epimerase (non-hydrolysing)
LKIKIIIGTRPEIIKMSPVIRECEKKELDYSILHTGQHYSYNLDRQFFEELNLLQENANLKVGSGSHAEETGRMLIGIEKILKEEQPDVVLVEGDTNTVVAGALAAVKLHIKVGHVEAGLRSYSREMPEEHNRIIADHISDYLFAPTNKSKETLIKEGIPTKRIFMTGNTIVDAIYQNLELAQHTSNILAKMKLKKDSYLFGTIHREEIVDNKSRLRGVLAGLSLVTKEYELPLLIPIHPRTRKMLRTFNIQGNFVDLTNYESQITNNTIYFIDPLGYFDFLQLESNAKLILTDSGGVQEEACILKVPCVTLRGNTERTETLEIGANILAGTEPNKILESVGNMLSNKRNWQNPFGDGEAAKKIIKIVQNSGRLSQ